MNLLATLRGTVGQQGGYAGIGGPVFSSGGGHLAVHSHHHHGHFHQGGAPGLKEMLAEGTFWPALGDAVLETAFTSLEVTLFVLIMMLLVDFLDASSKGRLGNVFHNAGSFKQSVFSSFLGAAPGCLGAFMSVSIYMRGMLTFGALMAGLIATCGDEAYIMLKLFPRDALKLFVILFGLGVAGGVLTDLVLKLLRVKEKPPICHSHGDCPPQQVLPEWAAPCASVTAGEGGQTTPCVSASALQTPQTPQAHEHHSAHACFYGESAGVKGWAALRRPSWYRVAMILPFIVVAAATIGGLMTGHDHGQGMDPEAIIGGVEAPDRGVGEGEAVLTGGSTVKGQEMGQAAGAVGAAEPSLLKTWGTRLKEGNLFLLILLGVTGVLLLLAPEGFLRNHVWGHVLKGHGLSVFGWVFGAMLVVAVAGLFVDLGHLARHAPLITAGAAILIGLIPQSGPNIIFLTMYAQGMVSFPILLLNSIVQDGHALLPLLSMSLKDVVKIKVIKVVLALVLGAGFLVAGVL